jgi:hypothetical protein
VFRLTCTGPEMPFPAQFVPPISTGPVAPVEVTRSAPR